jgi:hypothetical protein
VDQIKFTATIYWGDGTSSNGTVLLSAASLLSGPITGTVSASHVYATFGTFPVTIHVKDEAGAEGLGNLMALVSNLAPTVNPLPAGSFVTGQPFVLKATFSDPGLGDTHSVTIDWGDGTPAQTVNSDSLYAAAGGALLPEVVEPTATSPGRINIGHLYSDTLPHTVTLTVTDNGGLSSQASEVYAAGVHLFAVGAGAGAAPEVKVYDATTDALRFDFYAYDPSFTGGVRVAVGDVNGDGVPDIITGPGPGAASEIRVFNGVTGALMNDFYAFNTAWTGGVYVAAGDLLGRGVDDVIVGVDAGTDPEVRAFGGGSMNMAPLRDFYAYALSFTGGVRVAAAGIGNLGHDDIITGAGPGGDTEVRVFSGITGAMRQDYYAFGSSATVGIYVAGAANGNGQADVIVGAGDGSPEVRVFDGPSEALRNDFYAYSPQLTGGVRVGTLETSGAPPAIDLLFGAGSGAGAQTRVLDVLSLAELDNFFAFDANFQGGIFVGGD